MIGAKRIGWTSTTRYDRIYSGLNVSKERFLDQEQRLLAIREHLRVKARPESKDFEEEVASACVDKVRPIIERNVREKGESIIQAIASSLGVQFEEVTTTDDIKRVEQKYLVEQRELGFAVLERELQRADVDALLFQRMHAHANASDRWVAVLNLQASRSRGYWSRPHELVHRIAEPPQGRLPFFRHKADYENKLERLIDLGAEGLAFPKLAFAPIVAQYSGRPLTWSTIKQIGTTFAPTASLQSVAKAVLNYWPGPTILLIGAMRARRGDPQGPRDLRVSIDGFSSAGRGCGVLFFDNMRVPVTSPLMDAFRVQGEATDFELLASWQTSGGKRLPSRRALTSAIRVQDRAYALISPE
jgi:hypothetical protein